MRFRNSTGREPFSASRTSSSIWPLLISTTTKTRAVNASRWKCTFGNGYSVMGRSTPTLSPAARASAVTAFRMRPTMP